MVLKKTNGDFVQLGMFEGNSGSVLLLGFSWGVGEMMQIGSLGTIGFSWVELKWILLCWK